MAGVKQIQSARVVVLRLDEAEAEKAAADLKRVGLAETVGVTSIAELSVRIADGKVDVLVLADRDFPKAVADEADRLRPPQPALQAGIPCLLIAEGLWSQYLEVGIGPDAEIFTKCQPMAAVGHGADVGLHPISRWNNPEPEIVLAVDSRGRIKGATLGNDVNLRDVEGRSALLLGKAKDNNASCSLGPLVRLFGLHGPDAAEDAPADRDGQDGSAESESRRRKRRGRRRGRGRADRARCHRAPGRRNDHAGAGGGAAAPCEAHRAGEELWRDEAGRRRRCGLELAGALKLSARNRPLAGPGRAGRAPPNRRRSPPAAGCGRAPHGSSRRHRD